MAHEDTPNIYDAESEDEDLVLARLPSRSPKRPLVEDLDAINNGLDRSSKRIKGDGGGGLALPEKHIPQAGFGAACSALSKKSKVSQRTERYIYDGSSQNAATATNIQDEDFDDEIAQESEGGASPQIREEIRSSG